MHAVLAGTFVVVTLNAFTVVATERTETGDPARKATWEWTVEERIALRTNVEAAQSRMRSGVRRGAATTSTLRGNRPIVDAFDGKTHPELFLPHEVFDELVRMASAGDVRSSEVVRKGMASEVRRHDLPADFWERLRSMATVYAADLHALQDIGSGYAQQNASGRRRMGEALTIKQRELCRSAAEAFAAARREFGRERLDRFLYDAVAVNMFYVADRLPDPEHLRKAERGCR